VHKYTKKMLEKIWNASRSSLLWDENDMVREMKKEGLNAGMPSHCRKNLSPLISSDKEGTNITISEVSKEFGIVCSNNIYITKCMI